MPPQSSILSPQRSLLVGRGGELTQLQRWFAQALQGQRQLVFITGEPGIGKTTLIDAFLLGIGQEGTGNGQQTTGKTFSVLTVA